VWFITQENIGVEKKFLNLVYSRVAPGVAPSLSLLYSAALGLGSGCTEASGLCCVEARLYLGSCKQ